MSKPVVTEDNVGQICSRVYDEARMKEGLGALLDAGSATAIMATMRRAVEAALSASPTHLETGRMREAEGEWEYQVVEGPRKGDEPFTLESEGWERDYSRGREGEAWDRFDYHEEYYWKRRVALGRKP